MAHEWMEHKIEVVLCDCYSHGVSVQPGDLGDEVYLNMWYDYHKSPGLWKRLKTCWEALTDQVSTDCIVLNKNTIQQLIDQLLAAKEEVWPSSSKTITRLINMESGEAIIRIDDAGAVPYTRKEITLTADEFMQLKARVGEICIQT
jgi:hypothetical protein